MADTLLSVAQRVARRVGIDPTFTAFSNNDETNDLVQYINDAYQDLIDALPDDVPYLLNTSSSLSLVNGTRLYALDATARSFTLLEWSFRDSTDNNGFIEVSTLEFIQELYPNYLTDTGKPLYVYREGSDQLGVYPVPDKSYTLTYKFAKPFNRLAATTDSFLVPDHWLRYVEDKAKFYYDFKKGLQDASATMTLADSKLVTILTEAALMNPHFFLGDNYYV